MDIASDRPITGLIFGGLFLVIMLFGAVLDLFAF
jgi:hypothetical protein